MACSRVNFTFTLGTVQCFAIRVSRWSVWIGLYCMAYTWHHLKALQSKCAPYTHARSLFEMPAKYVFVHCTLPMASSLVYCWDGIFKNAKINEKLLSKIVGARDLSSVGVRRTWDAKISCRNRHNICHVTRHRCVVGCHIRCYGDVLMIKSLVGYDTVWIEKINYRRIGGACCLHLKGPRRRTKYR